MLPELILAKVAPKELHEEQADDQETLPATAEKHLPDPGSCSNPAGQDCKIAAKYQTTIFTKIILIYNTF